MINLNPTSDANKSTKNLSSQNGERIRDVSFSSFLEGTEETFMLKLAESEENSKSHNPNCLVRNHNLGSKKSEDNEIDVFKAEKYFSGRVEEDEKRGGFDRNTNDGHVFELCKSCMNSRSSLLSTQRSRKSINRWSSINRKKFFSKLGCRSCNDKNSVDIDVLQVARCSGRKSASMKVDELQTRSCVTDDFKFPVAKSNRGEEEEDDDGARKSLEVFGSPVPASRNMSVTGLSVERTRLNMLTWDGIDFEIPSKSSRLYNVVDSDSDASSDLFEIESLSTNPSSKYLTRQTSDAPSETSIDWSVVTASATDLAVMSDSKDLTRTNSGRIRTVKDYGGKTRRHSSILSGCYNNKAVMVAGDAHRTTGDRSASIHSKAVLATE